MHQRTAVLEPRPHKRWLAKLGRGLSAMDLQRDRWAAWSGRRQGAPAPPLPRKAALCCGGLLAGLLAMTTAAWAGRLEGQAVLLQPFPLPADAVLDVQLLELPASGGSLLLGRSRIAPRGRSPFAFSVPFLDGAIQPTSRYQLRATVHQADRLLFRTAAAVPVTPSRQGPLQLSLAAVGEAPLRGLLWLRAPAASVPTPPDAPRQEQQLRLDPLSRELSGQADCNRFIGRFELQGDSLRLEPAAGTRLDCEPEVIADEQRFLADLLQVRRWQLDREGRLELRDGEGRLLLLLETRPG